MLPPQNRLRRSADFRHALSRGRRCARRTLVVHAAPRDGHDGDVRVGFVVSRAVGKAVVRNQVRRRLREAAREQLPVVAQHGSWDVVVRATPRAAEAGFDELRRDLAHCLAPLKPVAP